MSKDAFSRNKVLTKAQFDKMQNVPAVWND
jgi:hypothetical protein